MKIKTKLRLIISSHVILLGLVVWGYIVFLRMYFNGYKMVFYINRYNEANLELVIIPILIFFHFIGLFLLSRLYAETKR